MGEGQPAGGNFGSPAAGSTPHFIGALLGKNAGVDLKHAAYRGTQPAMLDLLGGNISAVSGPIGDITQHLPTGKIRILGVSGAKRSRFAPDVPTFGEQGLKDMAFSEWFAFFLPAKAAPETVNRLNAAMKTALAHQGSDRRTAWLRAGADVVVACRTGRTAEEGHRDVGADRQEDRLHRRRLDTPPGLLASRSRPPPCRGQYLRPGIAGSAVFWGRGIWILKELT